MINRLIAKTLTLTGAALTLVLVMGSVSPALAGDKTLGRASDPGVLKTKVKPDDAGVWVDGEYVGHADRFNGPGEHLYLAPGEHEIRLTMVYFKEHTTKVTIAPGEKTVLRQHLEPSGEPHPTGPFGRVRIQPEGDLLNAAVIVDGMHIGYADQVNKIAQTLLLLPGEHKVEVIYTGYQPYVTTITVEANKKQIIVPTLTPK
jgi:hypothetical protein